MADTLTCPSCSEPSILAAIDRGGVVVDACPRCRGVWLDRGELDKLIELEASPNEDFLAEIRGSSSGREPPRGRDASPRGRTPRQLRRLPAPCDRGSSERLELALRKGTSGCRPWQSFSSLLSGCGRGFHSAAVVVFVVVVICRSTTGVFA